MLGGVGFLGLWGVLGWLFFCWCVFWVWVGFLFGGWVLVVFVWLVGFWVFMVCLCWCMFFFLAFIETAEI